MIIISRNLAKHYSYLNDENDLENHELDLALDCLEKSFSAACDSKIKNYMIDRLERLCERVNNIRQRLVFLINLKFHAQWFLSLLLMGIALSSDVLADEPTLKLFLTIDALLLGQALAQLLDFKRFAQVFTKNMADKLGLLRGYEGHKIDAPHLKGSMELLRLSFAYPESSTLLFNNYSFSFKAGGCYVICGPSGAGKSSLLKLLMGFYEPRSGYVIIDGQDIQSLNPSSLRKHFGFVAQSSRLLNASIFENIRAGRNIGREAVLDSCAQPCTIRSHFRFART